MKKGEIIFFLGLFLVFSLSFISASSSILCGNLTNSSGIVGTIGIIILNGTNVSGTIINSTCINVTINENLTGEIPTPYQYYTFNGNLKNSDGTRQLYVINDYFNGSFLKIESKDLNPSAIVDICLEGNSYLDNSEGSSVYYEPNSADLRVKDREKISISALIKVNADNGQFTDIVTMYGNYRFSYRDGQLTFEVFVWGNPSTWRATTPVGLIPGVWYNIVGVYDGEQIILYVNGNKAGSREIKNKLNTFNSNGKNNNLVLFAQQGYGVGRHPKPENFYQACNMRMKKDFECKFFGSIDELRIWKYVALNPLQVTNLSKIDKAKIYCPCKNETDCGNDSYVDSPLCMKDSVIQNFTDFTCSNPSTNNSFCSKQKYVKEKELCELGCENNSCKQDLIKLIAEYTFNKKIVADTNGKYDLVLTGSVKQKEIPCKGFVSIEQDKQSQDNRKPGKVKGIIQITIEIFSNLFTGNAISNSNKQSSVAGGKNSKINPDSKVDTSNAADCGTNKVASFEGGYFKTIKSMTYTNKMTTSVWFKFTGKDKKDYPLYGSEGNSQVLKYRGLRIRYGDNGAFLLASIDNTDKYLDYSILGKTNVNDGKWHHVVMVVDGNIMSLYLDGNIEGVLNGNENSPISGLVVDSIANPDIKNSESNADVKKPEVSPPLRSPIKRSFFSDLTEFSAILQIGKNSNLGIEIQSVSTFVGLMDEIKIWGRVLNSEEINAIYTTQKELFKNDFMALCKTNSDCGADGWIGNASCAIDQSPGRASNVTYSLYQDYKTFNCTNPGMENANCSSTIAKKVKEKCSFGCVVGTSLCNRRPNDFNPNNSVINNTNNVSNRSGGLGNNTRPVETHT